MRSDTQLLSARSVRWMDAGVVVWVVVWVVLGALVWHDVRAQADLTTSVIDIGSAIRETGETLGIVGGLPLVGSGIAEVAGEIATTGAEVEASGQGSRDAIMRVAAVSGIAVGVLPAALALLLYVPVRLAWRRDVEAVRAALEAAGAGQPGPGAGSAQAGGSGGLDRYLARRAVLALPWDRVSALSPDPWAAVDAGEVRALADAELARLGLGRPD
jgi:hypothetical protein